MDTLTLKDIMTEEVVRTEREKQKYSFSKTVDNLVGLGTRLSLQENLIADLASKVEVLQQVVLALVTDGHP